MPVDPEPPKPPEVPKKLGAIIAYPINYVVYVFKLLKWNK
jgi:hypothetical protein